MWESMMNLRSQFQDTSGWFGFVCGSMAGIPSLIWAVANSEWVPVVSGSAIGMMGLGWAVYRFPADRALKDNQELSRELDSIQEHYRAVMRRNARLEAENARLMAKLSMTTPDTGDMGKPT